MNELEDMTFKTTEGQYAVIKIPSVFDGDVPFMTFHTQVDGKNVECGKLWGKGGVLSFEGDVDESARVFFDNVIERNREFLMRSNVECEHDYVRNADCTEIYGCWKCGKVSNGK